MIRLNLSQKRQVDELIAKACANYNRQDGSCLLLDDTCPQKLSNSLNCRYFREAVLPSNKALQGNLEYRTKTRLCAVCGKPVVAISNRMKYCPACARRVHRRQQAESKRRSREKAMLHVDN